MRRKENVLFYFIFFLVFEKLGSLDCGSDFCRVPDGVLTGGLPKLLGAASTGNAGETFLLGGHLSVNRIGFWGDGVRRGGGRARGWPSDRKNTKKAFPRA